MVKSTVGSSSSPSGSSAEGRLSERGKRFLFRIVFTPVGTAYLVIAVVVLIRSLLARNAYEIALSCAALLFLLFFGVVGAWKAKKLQTLETGWKLPFPMTANAGEESLLSGLDAPVPWFFRLHFIVRGRFSPAGSKDGGCPVLAETSVKRGETVARFALDFPMSGVFHGDGFCRLRDIFGLYSFPCGITQRRTVKVRSAPCFGKNHPINAQSGAEDRRNKTTDNEERYYMREYTPGDRFRDINWKSSEKIDTLITRISPDNQEKVSRIEVCFRNFGPSQKPSLEALWLLDRAKARLALFLRNLKNEQASYIFHVRAAEGSWEIENEDDLDAFLEELAGISFSPPQYEGALPQGTGDIYVFSTACDFGLPAFLLACNPRPVSLFLIQPAVREKNAVRKNEIETFSKRDFPANGCVPFPRWLFRGKIKPLGAQANMVEMIYAETKI